MAGHGPIRNQRGEVVGIWLEDPKDAENEIYLRMLVASYGESAGESFELYNCVTSSELKVLFQIITSSIEPLK